MEQEDHADLLPHVEVMSRIPKFTRRREKAPAEPSKAPEPQPKTAEPSKTAEPAKVA